MKNNYTNLDKEIQQMLEKDGITPDAFNSALEMMAIKNQAVIETLKQQSVEQINSYLATVTEEKAGELLTSADLLGAVDLCDIIVQYISENYAHIGK